MDPACLAGSNRTHPSAAVDPPPLSLPHVCPATTAQRWQPNPHQRSKPPTPPPHSQSPTRPVTVPVGVRCGHSLPASAYHGGTEVLPGSGEITAKQWPTISNVGTSSRPDRTKT